jgi:hypothetical protein
MHFLDQNSLTQTHLVCWVSRPLENCKENNRNPTELEKEKKNLNEIFYMC